jgi:hypothetical protein
MSLVTSWDGKAEACRALGPFLSRSELPLSARAAKTSASLGKTGNTPDGLLTVFFHVYFSDPNQTFHFIKNVVMAGGLLQIVAHGAGTFSIDNRRARDSLAGEAQSLAR